MGTNYYARLNICPTCGRYDELHICKISSGWKPLFQAYQLEKDNVKIKSFEDLRRFLDNPFVKVKVFDDYDREIKKEEFIKKLEKAKENRELKSHFLEAEWEWVGVWEDAEGYEFTYREFS